MDDLLKGIPPAKEIGIQGKAKTLIDQGAITPTDHAEERLVEREIALYEVIEILKHGKRNPDKDEYNQFDDYGNEINRWSYAFDGKTRDNRSLRFGISFYDDGYGELILVVTAIEL